MRAKFFSLAVHFLIDSPAVASYIESMTTTAYANRVMDEHRNLLAQWESKWAAKGWRDQVCVTFRQQTGKFEVRGELKMKQTRYCATMAEVVDKVREVYGNGTLRHIETTPLCVGATCKRYAVV